MWRHSKVEDPDLSDEHRCSQGIALMRHACALHVGTSAWAFAEQSRRGRIFLHERLAARPSDVSTQRPTCRWEGADGSQRAGTRIARARTVRSILGRPVKQVCLDGKRTLRMDSERPVGCRMWHVHPSHKILVVHFSRPSKVAFWRGGWSQQRNSRNTWTCGTHE